MAKTRLEKENTVKKHLSIILIVSLISLATGIQAFARGSGKDAVPQVEKIKAKIAKLGTGEKAKVRIKLRSGEYTSLNLHIDITEMLSMRASIIRHTAEVFKPDLFIVDKEPTGLRGEVLIAPRHFQRYGIEKFQGRYGLVDRFRRILAVVEEIQLKLTMSSRSR